MGQQEKAARLRSGRIVLDHDKGKCAMNGLFALKARLI